MLFHGRRVQKCSEMHGVSEEEVGERDAAQHLYACWVHKEIQTGETKCSLMADFRELWAIKWEKFQILLRTFFRYTTNLHFLTQHEM